MEINLRPILKMLGVEVSAEHCKALQEIIPEIPAKLQQAVAVINGGLKNFDDRLRAIEARQETISRDLGQILMILTMREVGKNESKRTAGA